MDSNNWGHAELLFSSLHLVSIEFKYNQNEEYYTGCIHNFLLTAEYEALAFFIQDKVEILIYPGLKMKCQLSFHCNVCTGGQS